MKKELMGASEYSPSHNAGSSFFIYRLLIAFVQSLPVLKWFSVEPGLRYCFVPPARHPPLLKQHAARTAVP